MLHEWPLLPCLCTLLYLDWQSPWLHACMHHLVALQKVDEILADGVGREREEEAAGAKHYHSVSNTTGQTYWNLHYHRTLLLLIVLSIHSYCHSMLDWTGWYLYWYHSSFVHSAGMDVVSHLRWCNLHDRPDWWEQFLDAWTVLC